MTDSYAVKTTSPITTGSKYYYDILEATLTHFGKEFH